MANSICAGCGVEYRPCGSCGSSSTVCNSCKRKELVVKKRAELTEGKCLYYINDNFVGVYDISHAEKMMEVHVGGRIELKGDVNV